MVSKAKDDVLCVKAMQRASEHRELVKKTGGERKFVKRRAQLPASRENWRRKTSMTVELEPFMDDRERRAGLRRLVKWMQDAVQGEKAEGRRQKADEQKPHGRPLTVSQGGENGNSDSNDATALQNENCEMQLSNCDDDVDLLEEADDSSERRNFGVLSEWGGDAADWARVRRAGVSVEQLCERLGLSRARLTRLTREYCNLTAQEVIDGVRVKRLKPLLIARLRTAARELWGAPGYYAAFKCEGYMDTLGRVGTTPSAPPYEGGENGGAGMAHPLGQSGKSGSLLSGVPKRSKFFRTGENLFGELPFEERTRRVGELIERAWMGLDAEQVASRAGFKSAVRMKRACFTVTGRSLAQLERILAADIVEYYLCAEEKALRELALRTNTSVPVYRARELYHGKEDPPVAPFLDRWSAAEFAIPHWLAGMGEMLA